MRRRADFLLRQGLSVAGLSAVLSLGTAACDAQDSTGPGRDNSRGPAEQVESLCDGTLQGAQLDDLRALVNDIHGESFPIREGGRREGGLTDYVNLLSDEESLYAGYFCDIVYQSERGLHALADIVFGWERTSPLPGETEATLSYRAGESAYYSERGYGVIAFRCPVSESSSRRFVMGRIHIHGAGSPDPAMSVLNSVTRAVADELGCLEGANLPEGAPRQIEGEEGR